MAKRFNSYDEALAYVNTRPIADLICEYAVLLWETQGKNEKIRITQEQFESMFKIVGRTSDGEVERRGRKRKED